MSNLSRFGLLAACLFVINGLSAQLSVRDSLKQQISHYDNVSKEDPVYIDLILDLGMEHRFYFTDSLQTLSKKALLLSEKIGYDLGKAKAHLGLGTYFSDRGRYDESLKSLQKGLDITLTMRPEKVRLSILNTMGEQYRYKGNVNFALREFLKALEVGEILHDLEMLSVVNENIANLYISHKDYEEGMNYYEKVKKINEKIGDPVIMAESMSNMASVYLDMGKLELAMFNVNSAIKTFETHKILDWLAYCYQVKGKIYLKQDKNKWALYWYAQSELLHKGLDDKREEINLLTGIAEAHFNMDNLDKSLEYAEKAYELSNTIEVLFGTKDGAELLYKIYKTRGDYKQALTYHETFKDISTKISDRENHKGLTMLKTKMTYDRQKEQLIQENEKALAKQKNYVYAILSLLFIFLIITILIKRNAKIQERLNKELLLKQEDLERKEKHLKEINQTKNKLFSIIGHDLRGPIGAFQGLIKLFRNGSISKDEFIDFVPKLNSDIDHIAFTLNNLLSWGQTQMNGSNTKPGVTAIENIVSDNIALLSEIASAKSIKIVSKIETNTLTWCDCDQIDIVIRNLISNALKFTPENGMVTIEAVEKAKLWEICVRDSGIGMTEDTMAKIFDQSSNHTTYGTNDEKGTGLGLSLCKEMVEKNGGIIWVDSALNKGSSFYFTVPKAQKEYKKTA